MIWIAIAPLLLAGSSAPPAPEDPVAPYPQSNANAQAAPFDGTAMWQAFHGADGVSRVIDDTIERSTRDRRIADIFKAHDLVRLRRTLKEQFCYILNGGCQYTGRTMAAAHKDLGLQTADMGALVEHLQAAMNAEQIGFWAQNRLLAKLAPMKPSIIHK